jgi:hypothetical protein
LPQNKKEQVFGGPRYFGGQLVPDPLIPAIGLQH